MADVAFISADIEKLTQFENDSQDAIQEFLSIKEKFESINSDLLKKWKGEGADAYKYETDHILEKIGDVEEVLKSMNEGIVKTIKDQYSLLDEDLCTYNQNPNNGEESNE